MLTLILLVLLGGGLGLLAVSMAERQPAMHRRARRRGPAAPRRSSEHPRPTPVVSTGTTAPEGQPRLVRCPAGVHRSQTAVEGAFADVAVASVPRRVLAIVWIAVLVLGVAVMVTVIVGAAVGAGVALFDQTFR